MKEKSNDIKKLQDAITEMHILSKKGFSEISALARIVCKDKSVCSDIRSAMDSIQLIASHHDGEIEMEAEYVGCHFEGWGDEQKENLTNLTNLTSGTSSGDACKH